MLGMILTTDGEPLMVMGSPSMTCAPLHTGNVRGVKEKEAVTNVPSSVRNLKSVFILLYCYLWHCYHLPINMVMVTNTSELFLLRENRWHCLYHCRTLTRPRIVFQIVSASNSKGSVKRPRKIRRGSQWSTIVWISEWVVRWQAVGHWNDFLNNAFSIATRRNDN